MPKQLTRGIICVKGNKMSRHRSAIGQYWSLYAMHSSSTENQTGYLLNCKVDINYAKLKSCAMSWRSNLRQKNSPASWHCELHAYTHQLAQALSCSGETQGGAFKVDTFTAVVYPVRVHHHLASPRNGVHMVSAKKNQQKWSQQNTRLLVQNSTPQG